MEANRINLKLGLLNTPAGAKPVRKIQQGQRSNTEITCEQVIDWIKRKKLGPESEARLIAAAKKTPHGALYQFTKNWRKYA